MTHKRANGILLHISSLPGAYGIGTLGEEAYRFVDFLHKTEQTYWQILPVCPVGKGFSPYHSFSSFAGNPLFIDPPLLCRQGYLTDKQLADAVLTDSPERVDYPAVAASREVMFQAVFDRFIAAPPSDFADFCRANADWLDDYALFMAIREAQHDLPLQQWSDDIRTRQPQALTAWKSRCAERIQYHCMLQYLFFNQWAALKSYANERGVRIIGDIPIYVSPDSADVWASPHLFQLTAQGNPSRVAGCPPDAFCEDGQLWGNPLYDWGAMKQDGYRWWIRRLDAGGRLYDVIRIDHFRAFAGYYSIPADARDARAGEWKQGPGMHLWNAVHKQLGDLPIIAEDLGHLTPDVEQLVKDSGFPGMKVLQFAFGTDRDNPYLPEHYEKNCVVYTGTHDNDTILGWAQHAPKAEIDFAKQYLDITRRDGLRKAMMSAAMKSVADTCILTIQDVCALGGDARMNVPSTVGGNWSWRLRPDQLTATAAAWLKKHTRLTNRAKENTHGKLKK